MNRHALDQFIDHPCTFIHTFCHIIKLFVDIRKSSHLFIWTILMEKIVQGLSSQIHIGNNIFPPWLNYPEHHLRYSRYPFNIHNECLEQCSPFFGMLHITDFFLSLIIIEIKFRFKYILISSFHYKQYMMVIGMIVRYKKIEVILTIRQRLVCDSFFESAAMAVLRWVISIGVVRIIIRLRRNFTPESIMNSNPMIITHTATIDGASKV